MPNGTPFCNFIQEFSVIVSAASGAERVLARGVEIVLEVVSITVNERYPSLMLTLYPGVMATEPQPFGTLDAMWFAFQSLANNKTPSINGDLFCSLPASSSGARSSAPPGARPALKGAARAGRLINRLHGGRDCAIIRLS